MIETTDGDVEVTIDRDDGGAKVRVRVDPGVELTTLQVAELLERDVSVITKQLQSAFAKLRARWTLPELAEALGVQLG